MNKIKKVRLILLLGSIAFVIVGLILSVVTSLKVDQYRKDLNVAITAANPDATITGLNTSDSTALGTIFSAAAALFFYIFALIYFFARNHRVQGRKWPYITMIVLGGLGILLKVVSLLWVYGKAQPTPLSGVIDTEANRLIVEQVWSTYKSLIVAIAIVTLFLSVAVIACHIAQLVLIKKDKDNLDVAYSNEIIKAAQAQSQQAKQNDLP